MGGVNKKMIFEIKKLPFKLTLFTPLGKNPSKASTALLKVIKEISLNFKVEDFNLIIGDSFFNCRHNDKESFWESEDKKPEGKVVQITVKKIDHKYVINEQI